MEPINFVYWLQGFLELQNPTSFNEEQIKEIKNHINLVLTKATNKIPQEPIYTWNPDQQTFTECHQLNTICITPLEFMHSC